MTDEKMDLSRECFCTCHIPICKLSTNPAFGVWVRIACTRDSPDATTCGTCRRSGKDKYVPMNEAAAREFEKLARVRRALSNGDIDEAVLWLERVGTDGGLHKPSRSSSSEASP
jgi:hypothetical protein